MEICQKKIIPRGFKFEIGKFPLGAACAPQRHRDDMSVLLGPQMAPRGAPPPPRGHREDFWGPRWRREGTETTLGVPGGAPGGAPLRPSARKMPQVRAKCDQSAPSGVQKNYFRAWERTENVTKSLTRDLGSKRFSYELLVLIGVRRFGNLPEKNNSPRFQV